MDSRDSLDQTPDSIDLTESPVKNINMQRDIEKINEDTSDDDIDEMIDFNKDKARMIYRKYINEQRKRAKIVKSKKGKTTKIYAINIERKRLLKRSREKVLQNAKDRKLGKANIQLALQASIRANRASNDTQSITNTDAAAKGDDNTDAVIGAENTDNTAIDAENTDNAATDRDNTDDAVIGNDNTDDAIIGDDNTNAVIGNYNTDDAVTGEASTVHVPLPLHSKGKAKDPSQIKTFSKHAIPIAEPSIHDPLPDDHGIVKASGHTVDLSDVCTYEVLIQGAPNPCDLEGIEEDQSLEIQQNIPDKLKQRNKERERNITKRMKQYEEKYDFINKALLESVTHITEMTKTDHPMAAAKVKSADKMVMLPLLFDGSKPEVAKQHYERFNQYIKFQTKSGNIKDPIVEAIQLFEHTHRQESISLVSRAQRQVC